MHEVPLKFVSKKAFVVGFEMYDGRICLSTPRGAIEDLGDYDKALKQAEYLKKRYSSYPAKNKTEWKVYTMMFID